MSTHLSLRLLAPFLQMPFWDSFTHADYYYTSNRVKGLVQETILLFPFYPSPLIDVAVEIFYEMMQLYRTGSMFGIGHVQDFKEFKD